ncbi:TetR family transcriptional regulator C-terminal domain-containing protein [Neoaquamicrobium microcysteis]
MLEQDLLMKNDAATAARPAEGERRGRKASKETRRLQLIEATIDSLARRGYSETTMADVADGAGLSRGIVNFHFESKEKLLVATLQHMAEEYSAHWRGALGKAGPEPAARLAALVGADFDRAICNRRKLTAWCAFWGEARSRPTYQALCGASDEAYHEALTALCAEMIEAGGYALDARQTAIAIEATLEGLWLRLMLRGGDITREKAHDAAKTMLTAFFPRHFARKAG